MRYVWYIAWFCLFAGCTPSDRPADQLHVVPEFTPLAAVAGQGIAFQFRVNGRGNPKLLLENALGKSLVNGNRAGNKVSFHFPAPYVQKTGDCNWTLLHDEVEPISGTVSISPGPQSPEIETYLGPRNIYAGRIDHTMLVAAPTDVYDNPLPDGSDISLSKQVLGARDSQTVQLRHFIGWERILSDETAARMFLSATAGESFSKELTVDIHPSSPVDFEITYQRNHAYADGNQLITFTTSVIRDRFQNIVSEGTLVSFLTTDRSGHILTTQGSTIRGVAQASMLHPSREDEWSVRAVVAGSAGSPEVSVHFLPVIKGFNLEWDAKEKTLTAGPVISFIKQFQPDGMKVRLTLFDEDENQVEKFLAPLAGGFSRFRLDETRLPTGVYRALAEVGGVVKEIKIDLKSEK